MEGSVEAEVAEAQQADYHYGRTRTPGGGGPARTINSANQIRRADTIPGTVDQPTRAEIRSQRVKLDKSRKQQPSALHVMSAMETNRAVSLWTVYVQYDMQ